MVLYFIGLGLNDEKDVSVKGLEAIEKCQKIYLENYTAVLSADPEKLESLYSKRIILANREIVEKNPEQTILRDAQESDVAFLVVGDILAATTHVDLWLRAKELGIETQLIHNASVFSAIAVTGLQIYKFGKTTSIPFPQKDWQPQTPYGVIKSNKQNDLHTLLLLDLLPDKKKFMSVNQAIEYLLEIEEQRKEQVFTDDTFCVGCARLGSEKPVIISGKAINLQTSDFGKPMHCLIVPANMHFMEKKALGIWEQV